MRGINDTGGDVHGLMAQSRVHASSLRIWEFLACHEIRLREQASPRSSPDALENPGTRLEIIAFLFPTRGERDETGVDGRFVRRSPARTEI